MGLPLILMAVGTGLQMYGQHRANMQQAEAERANAAFYREQAALQEASTRREMAIQERQQQRLRGEQVASFAGGNVDVGTGSALEFLVSEEVFAIEERAAIRTEGDFRVRLAMLRASSSDGVADTLSSSQYNLLQAGTTLLGSAGAMASQYSSTQTPKTGNKVPAGRVK